MSTSKEIRRGACISASIFFTLITVGLGVFGVRARADTPPEDFTANEVCPELKNLKNSAATIGGNAWNGALGWIYHHWPADDESSPFRVKKLEYKSDGSQSGAELYGWSSYNRLLCAAERARGNPNNCPSICWGKTCGQADSQAQQWNNDSPAFCADPTGAACTSPPWTDYSLDASQHPDQVAKGAYAELDYSHPVRIYQVTLADGTRTTMTGDEVEKNSIARKKRAIQHCLYPVNGWLKIRQLKEGGWVKLNGRINSATVPIPVPGVDPGENYKNWPTQDCSTNSNNPVCTYQVLYDPLQKEFAGWAWNPRIRWISFSGSTHYQTGSLWHNTYICGESCAKVSYDVNTKKSKWNSSFIGVWVKALGGNIFAQKGFSGVAPPPGEANTPYLIVTGRYTDSGTTKSGAVAPWESLCDDPDNPSCSRVGPKAFDPHASSPDNERAGALPNLFLPRASTLANRSLIKRSVLGTIDVSGFLPASDTSLPHTNAKGNRVQKIADETALWNAATSSANGLGNTVYYVDGDLVLGATDTATKVIYNSLNSSSGAGTVVVRGNIIIKRPFEYSKDTVANFNRLASLSWIALKRVAPASSLPPYKPLTLSDADWKAGGNIIVADCLPPNQIPSDTTTWLDQVNQGQQLARIAGTFFAENILATGTGNGTSGSDKCTNLSIPFTTTTRIYPERGQTCSGIKTEKDGVVTCTLTQQKTFDVPLEIEGIVVAKQILFQRIYRGRNRGSEVIVNTGRMAVNPGPGLSEFSKSLPLW